LQPVKLLSQREDYTTCHIHIPGDEHRLPAIAVDGKFYGFFRASNDPTKTLGLLLKLAARGDEVVATPTKRGYALWVHEPTGTLAKATNRTTRTLLPTMSPADCWIISDRQPGFRTCSLRVPDLPDTVPGLANGQRLYSLYRREKDADSVLKLSTRLSQRGDEVVVLVSLQDYVLCIYEPGAAIAA